LFPLFLQGKSWSYEEWIKDSLRRNAGKKTGQESRHDCTCIYGAGACKEQSRLI